MSIRIIAGKFKGRLLKTPKGAQTRPTQSMLREAVFNICQNAIEGAKVLDLFAGSGAMGFEALSRGALSATFIEKHRLAISTIRENIASLDVAAECRLIASDAETALKRCDEPFDIVYLDPPYGTLIPPLVEILAARKLLAEGAFLFTEQGIKNGEAPASISGLKLVNSRRFGDTLLHYYTARD